MLALLWTYAASAETAIPWEKVKGLHPYAKVGVAYDSNLLRRPEAEIAILRDLYGGASDVYATVEAGFGTSFDFSRQRLSIDGRIYHVSYDRFDQLDHTGGDAHVLWNWVKGSLWEGDLGYTFIRKQRDFANEIVPTNDMLDRNRFEVTANRWLTSKWRFGALANVADTAFDKSEDLNLTLFGAGAKLDYVSLAGGQFGIDTLYSKGRYSNQPNRDYQQINVGPTVEWKPTTKTQIRANVAYETLTHDVQSERDFQGLVGRVRATWKPSVKTSLAAVLWRDFSNLEDESANFAIIDAISVEPAWSITTKMTLRALASFQRQDYQRVEDTNIVSDLDPRVDDVTYFGIWVDWRLRSNVSVSLGYSTGSRESTRILKDYDFQNFQVTIIFGL